MIFKITSSFYNSFYFLFHICISLRGEDGDRRNKAMLGEEAAIKKDNAQNAYLTMLAWTDFFLD